MPVTADSYFPFDAGAGANVTEDQWRTMARLWRGSGVVPLAENGLEVFADSTGMQVKVRTGQCWVAGHYGKFTSEKTLPITTAHATLPRKDRVIVRADFTNNRVELDVLAGTAAASPAVPALTQSTSMWEIPLAQVSVPAADVSIDAAQVTNESVQVAVHPLPIVTCFRNANQSIASSVITTIAWDNEGVKTVNSMHSTSVNNSRITIPFRAIWKIETYIQYAISGGIRYLELRLNGVTSLSLQRQDIGGGVGDIGLHAVKTHILNAGDYIEVRGYHDFGSNIDVVGGAPVSQFTVEYYGPPDPTILTY